MLRPTRKVLVLGAAGFFLVAAGALAVVATTGDDCPFTGPDAAHHCVTWNAHGAYCQDHPGEGKCPDLLQHAEQARFCRDSPDDARCAKTPSSDDHAEFCHQHPDSPHCKA